MDIGVTERGLLVDGGAGSGPAVEGNSGRCRVAAGGVIVVGARRGVIVSRLVPLVDVGQKVSGAAIAIQIVRVVAGVARFPQLKTAIGVKFVGWRSGRAGVEPIDKLGRLEPGNGTGRLIGAFGIFCDTQVSQGVRLIDHVFGDFELAHAIGPVDRADRVGIAGGVGRVAGFADFNKFDVKQMGAAAEGVGIGRSSTAECYSKECERKSGFH